MDEDSILQFDWKSVEGKVVTAVLGDPCPDGSSWWCVAICLDDQAVILEVNGDTDEIIARYEVRPTEDTWKPVDPLKECIGKELSWCWTGRNSQGYLDMLTISLSNIDPAVAFVAAASSLSFKRLVDMPEAS